MRRVDLRVYGEPAPQGSKRHIGNGRFIEASSKVKPWRAAVANAVALLGDIEQFVDPVKVTVTFYLPKGKTVKREYPSIAPDLDKLQRGLGDGLSVSSSLISDDSLIIEWHARKLYATSESPIGAYVIIENI